MTRSAPTYTVCHRKRVLLAADIGGLAAQPDILGRAERARLLALLLELGEVYDALRRDLAARAATQGLEREEERWQQRLELHYRELAGILAAVHGHAPVGEMHNTLALTRLAWGAVTLFEDEPPTLQGGHVAEIPPRVSSSGRARRWLSGLLPARAGAAVHRHI